MRKGMRTTHIKWREAVGAHETLNIAHDTLEESHFFERQKTEKGRGKKHLATCISRPKVSGVTLITEGVCKHVLHFCDMQKGSRGCRV